MDKNLSLKSLSRDSVSFLIAATNRMFAVTLLGEPTEAAAVDIEIPELIKLFGKNVWKGKAVLFKDLKRFSEFKNAEITKIKEVSDTLYKLEEDLGKTEKELSGTTVGKEKLEELQEAAVKEEQRKARSKVSDEVVREAIKRKQEIYAKVRLAEPKIDEEKQKGTEKIISQIKEAPTKEAINFVSEEIKSRVPEEVSDDAIGITAATIVANIQSNHAPVIQSAAIETGVKKPSSPDLATLLSDQSKSLAELKNLTSLTKNVTELAFGKEFREIVLPDVTIDDISVEPSTGYVPIQIPPVRELVIDKTETPTIAFGRSWVEEQLANPSLVQGANYDPKALQSSFSAFKPLSGFAKDAAISSIKNVALKPIKKAIVSKIATVVGGTTGGPAGAAMGLAVGKAIDWISDKINWKNIKRYSAYIAGGSVLLVSVPFVGIAAGVGLGILTTGIAMGFGAGAGSLTLGGIASGVAGFLSALAGATIAAVGVPILAALLIIPVTVAFIIFIINSGAYVVPPTDKTSLYAGFTLSKDITCSADKKYCFPVAPLSGVNFVCKHHDYPASDIMRNGDKPGKGDDKPVTIVAYTAGTVQWTTSNNRLGGVSLMIAGDDGRFYYYAHNERNLVSAGQHVTAGQPIALMDSTGNASGTEEHVHFGISKKSDFVTMKCPGNVAGIGCKTEAQFKVTISYFILPSDEFKNKLGINCPH